MENNIIIQEANNDVSFKEIKEVMTKAHEAAKNDKLSFPTSSLSIENLKEITEKGGKWFLAICNKKIVGTIFCEKQNKKSWYHTGEAIVMKYVAVLPEYSGRHIVSKLYNSVFEYAKKIGINICIMSMSEFNYHHQHVAEKNGFILIDFFAVKKLKNYTLSYAYWIDKNCPYSNKKIKVMIAIRKMKAKIKRIIYR